jgi:hypothetical protein
MSDPRTGDRGFILDRGTYCPARIVCDDLVQTFGPIDQIAAYTKDSGKHEFTVRLTHGFSSCDGRRWVTAEEWAVVERRKLLSDMDELRVRFDTMRAALANGGSDA